MTVKGAYWVCDRNRGRGETGCFHATVKFLSSDEFSGGVIKVRGQRWSTSEWAAPTKVREIEINGVRWRDYGLGPQPVTREITVREANDALDAYARRHPYFVFTYNCHDARQYFVRLLRG
ncbi:hypothetical protein TWF694_006137 [Orbilia ellipsospora]|uniref:DUF4105 domain-containing protein n=1 Tax=Orbilia ellipsospora TaxID=2528407 RepID=A0AAV9WSG5_9PEZI